MDCWLRDAVHDHSPGGCPAGQRDIGEHREVPPYYRACYRDEVGAGYRSDVAVIGYNEIALYLFDPWNINDGRRIGRYHDRASVCLTAGERSDICVVTQRSCCIVAVFGSM